MKIFRSCSWFYNQVILSTLKNRKILNSRYDRFNESTADESDVSADDFDSSDDCEEDENEFYERVRNDWEWLSLRYERRLNELLKMIKNNNTNNNTNSNITNKVNVNLTPFLSFIPNIMQSFLTNYLDKTINAGSSLSIDGLDSTEKNGSISFDSDFYGNIIELMKNGIFEGDVPIMFCDISGFTNLTQRIENSEDPQSVANLGRFLNDFFDPIINLIYHFNGDIIKFSGDAILAIFCDSDKSAFLSHNNTKELSADCTDVNDNVDKEKDLERCLNCIKCCIELHNILNNYPIHYSNYETNHNSEEMSDNITIHISCIYGNIKIKLVGGIFERYEYVVIGDVLSELKILSNLSKSSETVISPTLYNKVRNHIHTQQIIFDNNTYHKLLSLENDKNSLAQTDIDDFSSDDNLSMVAQNSLDTLSSGTVTCLMEINKFDNNLDPSDLFVDNSLLLKLSEINQKNDNIIIKLLKFFMPRYIYNRLLINQFNICNNEMRKITIIFINFRINTTSNTVTPSKLPYSTITDVNSTNISTTNPQDTKVDLTNPDNNSVKHTCGVDSGVLNEIMLICQKCTYSYEGTINKLIVDDKGISILIFMGFPPLFHEDDAFRSILLSLKVFKMSKKIGFNVGIGICTGKVWCGLLGNKLRNEFTSIGNIVNISNRLMMHSFNLQQHVNSDNPQVSQENTTNTTDSLKVHNNLTKPGSDLYNILIDENTYNECSSMIELLELEKIKVKGKDEKLTVYTPTGKLKIHSNDDMNTSDNNIVNDTIIKHLYHNTELISLFSTDKENNTSPSILEDSEDNHIIVINDETTMNNRLIHKYIDNNTDDDYKVLYVNYDSNRLIYNTLEHTYKLLIHKIISLYNNNSISSNGFAKFNAADTDEQVSYLNVEESLKMLLNPKLHWYINILNKLIDNKNSDNKLQQLLSNTYNTNNVNALQLLLSSTKTPNNLPISTTKPRDVNVQNIINNEMDNLENYIYSLIKGINLHYHIILIVNIVKANSVNSRENKVQLNNGEQLKGVHIDMARIDKLLKKLIKYNEKRRKNPSTNKFTLVVLNNDHTVHGVKDPVGISTSKVIDIKRLKKAELKHVLSNIMNENISNTNTDGDSDSKEVYDNTHVDVLVDNVYNITNGVHSITYEFIRYLIDNNFNYDKFSNHLYKFFHTTNKSVDDKDANDGSVKSDSVGLEEKQIIKLVHNYYEYKLNVIKSDELFILKILTILNKPIELSQLGHILSNHKNNINPEDISVDDPQASKKVDVEEHVNRLLLNNLIESDDENGAILVNNKILKGIISNIILPDEKIRIIDNLAVHT